MIAKTSFLNLLYVGTYCEKHGQLFSWNRSIDELQCIPATNIVTIGGYFQVITLRSNFFCEVELELLKFNLIIVLKS